MKRCETCNIITTDDASFCPEDGHVLASDEVATRLQAALGAKYTLTHLIGKGAMGAVYRARHRDLDDVAIKVMLGPPDNQQLSERFIREARALRKLRHQHAVTIYDVDRSTPGLTYMVMEMIAGGNLREDLRERGRLTLDEVMEIATAVCGALQAAHERGIIHRDIKPDNILMAQETTITGKVLRTIKIADFGIVKLRGNQRGGEASIKLTQYGTPIGTPFYMSPEQWFGEGAGITALDGRTDLYALGCTLYELLSGRTPFVGNTTSELRRQHLEREAPPLYEVAKNVPEPVSRVIMRTLAKDRDERYQSAAEFASELRRAYDESFGKTASTTRSQLISKQLRETIDPTQEDPLPPPSPRADRQSTMEVLPFAQPPQLYNQQALTEDDDQEPMPIRLAKAVEEARRRIEEEQRLVEEEHRRAEEEERLKAEEEEAKRREEEAARLRREEEERKRAEEEALRAEQERRLAEEEEARRKAEEEARQREEEERRLAAEAEAKRKAEEEEIKRREEEAARLLAEEEARRRAEEEARRLDEEEERRRAEEEARRLAEEERLRAEAEARRLEEEEAARQRAEEEAKRKAEEEEIRRREEEAARLLAEQQARERAEKEAKQKEEEAARLRREEEERKRAEEEALRAEQERRLAEEEARRVEEERQREQAQRERVERERAIAAERERVEREQREQEEARALALAAEQQQQTAGALQPGNTPTMRDDEMAHEQPVSQPRAEEFVVDSPSTIEDFAPAPSEVMASEKDTLEKVLPVESSSQPPSTPPPPSTPDEAYQASILGYTSGGPSFALDTQAEEEPFDPEVTLVPGINLKAERKPATEAAPEQAKDEQQPTMYPPPLQYGSSPVSQSASALQQQPPQEYRTTPDYADWTAQAAQAQGLAQGLSAAPAGGGSRRQVWFIAALVLAFVAVLGVASIAGVYLYRRFRGETRPPVQQAVTDEDVSVVLATMPKGTVTVNAPQGSEVFVDDERAGSIGEDGSFTTEALAGVRNLRVTKSGSRPWIRDTQVAAGSTAKVTARLQRDIKSEGEENHERRNRIDRYLRAKNYYGAEVEYRALLKESPEDATVYAGLADALYVQQRYAEALVEYEAVLRLQPNNMQALLSLGQLYEIKRRDADAENTFSRAVELQPKNASAQALLAWVLLRRGKLDQASQAIEQAIQIKDDPEYQDTKAYILLARGQMQEALSLAQSNVDKSKDPSLKAVLAVTLHRMGRTDEAVTTYRQLRQSSRDDEWGDLKRLSMFRGYSKSVLETLAQLINATN